MWGRFKYKQTICVGMLLKKFFSFIVLKKCYFAAANVITSRVKNTYFLKERTYSSYAQRATWNLCAVKRTESLVTEFIMAGFFELLDQFLRECDVWNFSTFRCKSCTKLFVYKSRWTFQNCLSRQISWADFHQMANTW